MTNIESAIVKKLKEELERCNGDYYQWILGVAIKRQKGKLKLGQLTYTARVVLKTNVSIYVDGMDIGVKTDGIEVLLAPDCFENTPE